MKGKDGKDGPWWFFGPDYQSRRDRRAFLPEAASGESYSGREEWADGAD